MRAIAKAPEPVSLTTHRQTRHCDYENYAAKDDLRNALVSEQRGLCCYCMGRIRNEPATMKIEHWRCRAHHHGEQLNYRNLLGSCQGGEGQPRFLQHCDTRKGDMDLAWNPAAPAHRIETRLRYELDGTIRSDDADFDVQLNDVLNLNLQVLRNNRKVIYDEVLRWWRKQRKRNHGRVPRERLDRELARHDAEVAELPPYRQVAVWLLRQKLAGMAA